MYPYAGRFCSGLFAFGKYPYGGGLLMMGLGLILLLVLAYFLFRIRGSQTGEAKESPLDLLKKRYINGEISQEEYQEKKNILGK
jgi:putative membrane protein